MAIDQKTSNIQKGLDVSIPKPHCNSIRYAILSKRNPTKTGHKVAILKPELWPA